MEVLFNFMWVMVAIAAVVAWRLIPAKTDSRSQFLVQMVALALLLVVLFPVISLTDDFQTSTAWAESESTARRILVAHQPAAIATAAVAVMTVFQIAPQTGPATTEILPMPHAAFQLPLWISAAGNRPPPLA